MGEARRAKGTDPYLAVDIGGTKIQATLAKECGTILDRDKCPTPREGEAEDVLAAMDNLIQGVLDRAGLKPTDLAAIGIAVPGVVDPETGEVAVTPNMNLTGVNMGKHVKRRFRVPVALGNDCNLGTLGEAWLGSARGAATAVGILVGTGIGCGIVYGRGKIWRGAREAAAEIGHIVAQMGGPECGCGNRGCLEALAGRSAIERDIRTAAEAGRTTALTEILEGDLRIIRSGALRRAIDEDDPLTVEVLQRASEVLGHACLTVRHLIDPELIVLGGGVIEACGHFVVPIVQQIVGADRLPGARPGGHVLVSALGDDAVVLGAVALARQQAGRNPFKKKYVVRPQYAEIRGPQFGKATVGDEVYERDVYVNVNGQVKKRKKEWAKEQYGTSHVIGPRELRSVCRGGPQVLFIGTGHSNQVRLADEGRTYLDLRRIQVQLLPTPEAAEAYNHSDQRRAALLHVTC